MSSMISGAAPRVAVGAFFTECNHFSRPALDYAAFESNEMRRGRQMLAIGDGTVGGMMQTLRRRDATIVPLMATSAACGGAIVAEAYRRIRDELIERLEAAMPVQGVLLSLHGAATVENLDDPEGDILSRARRIVGDDVPIVASLDLHAHVTEQMVASADALVAYETYPHRDAFDTGRRAAEMLLDIVDGRIRPTMALAKVPLLVSAINGSTDGDGPFAKTMRVAKSHEGRDGILSASVILVHPYIDLPDMGGGAMVISDGDEAAAISLARRLAMEYWTRRFDLEPIVYDVADAIRRGCAIAGEGPVLLVETADCCGGGAAGDSVHALRALIDVGAAAHGSIVPVVDPLAAAACHAAGAGADLRLSLGHRIDPQWGIPLTVAARVAELSDGSFVYDGGPWAGLRKSMGPTALIEIDGPGNGAIRVMVSSQPTYDWANEQFRSLGLDVRQARFLVVKNPMNFRTAYGKIARGLFILDTPGPTPATLRHVNYRRRARPYFPADGDIANLEPSIFTRSCQPLISNLPS